MIKKIRLFYVLCICCWCLKANAYVDPSTSLFLAQGFFAIIGAIIFYIRHPIEAIKNLWVKIKNKPDA